MGEEDKKPNNGSDMQVTDSIGRVLHIHTMGPVDTLNLIEAAGVNSGNPSWMRMAMVVHSVRQIDDTPLPICLTKKDILSNARKLGNEGMVAATLALFPQIAQEPGDEGEDDDEKPDPQAQAEDEAKETAKN